MGIIIKGPPPLRETAWSSSDPEDNNFVCPRQDCLIEWFYQRCFFLRPVLLCLSTLLFHLTIKKRAKQQWSSKDRSENKSANLAAALLWPRWLNVSKQLAFKMGPREQFITTTVWSLGTDKKWRFPVTKLANKIWFHISVLTSLTWNIYVLSLIWLHMISESWSHWGDVKILFENPWNMTWHWKMDDFFCF